MICREEDLAARFMAGTDSILFKDNGRAIEEGGDLQAQLHYTGWHAELSAERQWGTQHLKNPKNHGLKSWLFGDIADTAYRPDEVLGDAITRPVLEAKRKYNDLVASETDAQAKYLSQAELDRLEGKLDPELISELRDASGLNDAMDDALLDIEDNYQDSDPLRYEYGKDWLDKEIGGRGRDKSQLNSLQRAMASNINQNLLVNNIRAGLLNHTQVATTTLPRFGLRDTMAGISAYKKALKAKSPELLEVGGEQFYEKQAKWDFFSRPEGFNQGSTYFTAKAKAKREGLSEADAREAGHTAVEDTQFKFRPGNRPRGYWQNSPLSTLNLMSYTIQMRKMHHGWVQTAFDGIKTGNVETFNKGIKPLLYFYGANMALNGASSAVPEELADLLKVANPNIYNQIRQGDRFSLFGLFGVDTAEIARIPITNVGVLMKVGTLASVIERTSSAIEDLSHNFGNPKGWIRAAKNAALVLPPVPVIGNKNAGNLLEASYRTLTGDYTRTAPNGKRFSSNAGREWSRAILGPSNDDKLGVSSY